MLSIKHYIKTHLDIARLAFDSPRDEAGFRQYYAQTFMRYRRVALVVALLLIGALGPFDFYVYGETWHGMAILKYGFALPICLALMSVTFSSRFNALQQEVVTISSLMYSFTLTGMLATSGDQQAIQIYHPSYLVLAFFVGAMARLLFARAIIVMLLTGLAYNLLIIFFRPQPFVTILSYNLFYCVVAVMSIVVNYYMELACRREYRHMLQLEGEKADLKEDNEDLKQRSTFDQLTSLYNRQHMEQAFLIEWERCLRNNKPLALVLLDVDHFQLYNERSGHEKGNDCLLLVAHAIRKSISRRSDISARYGGEVFAILMPEVDGQNALESANNVVDRVRRLEIDHPKSYTSAHVTLSAGVASVWPNKQEHYSTLVKQAQEALASAKQQGRNQAMLFSNILSED